MKYIKWKSLIISSLLCLAPVLLGVALWENLPDKLAIHFNFNNEPDNFAPKGFVVFGLPLLMFALQSSACVLIDTNAYNPVKRKKLDPVSKWIIPFITIIVYMITLLYGIGKDIDIRKACALMIGILFLATGSYLPRLDYVKNKAVDKIKAKKINRFVGIETVIIGLFFIISIFLPPVATKICVFLLIPYGIIASIYGMMVTRKK